MSVCFHALRHSLPFLLQIHWFSIINSCVTVLLLTGFLATILLRVLKNDFLKYTKDDEMGAEQEETGWKYLHGDVFRFPPHINLLSACLGVGAQVGCSGIASEQGRMHRGFSLLCHCLMFLNCMNPFSTLMSLSLMLQTLVIALFIFSMALVGMFYPYNRGAMLAACVVLYALTAGISGEPSAKGLGMSDCDPVSPLRTKRVPLMEESAKGLGMSDDRE